MEKRHVHTMIVRAFYSIHILFIRHTPTPSSSFHFSWRKMNDTRNSMIYNRPIYIIRRNHKINWTKIGGKCENWKIVSNFIPPKENGRKPQNTSILLKKIKMKCKPSVCLLSLTWVYQHIYAMLCYAVATCHLLYEFILLKSCTIPFLYALQNEYTKIVFSTSTP